MKTLGVLIAFENASGQEGFGVINPEHPYIVLTPEQTPDDFLPVVAQLNLTPKTTVLGIVVDPEVET